MLSALLAFASLAIIGCETEAEPTGIPTTPTPVLEPLSVHSDAVRAEQILPWTELVEACSGIQPGEPVGGFGRPGDMIEVAPGQTMTVEDRAGEAWVLSRFLTQGQPEQSDFKGFSISYAYLADPVFATVQLGTLDEYDYEKTQIGESVIARSPDSELADPDGVTSYQIFIHAGNVLAHMSRFNSTEETPYCDDGEMDSLADLLVNRLD